MEQMNYDDFKEQLRTGMEDILGADYEVGFCKCLQTNQGMQETVSIRKRGEESRVTTMNRPAYRLYREYMKGGMIKDIVREAVFSYKGTARRARDITLGLLESYGNAKGHLFYKVINAAKNEEILKSVFHRKVQDLAIVFCVLFECSEEGMSSGMLENEMVRKWGVDPEELVSTAMANTERLLPVEMKPLDDVVAEIMEKRGCEIPEETRKYFENEINKEAPKIYLLTNQIGINGFSAVFYRDVLKRLAEKFSSYLYVLPCSIHEALVLPADEKVKAGNLADIVAEVNRECVVPEEYLSDSVYYYDYMQDDFRIVATTRATKTGYMDPDRIENSVG